MTIEVTNEMVCALNANWPTGVARGEGMRLGLAAVLAIVERDYSVHRRATAKEITGLPKPPRRLKLCVENWPAADEGDYDPHCCRWPKSCSATSYDPARVTDDDLEPER